MSDCCFCVTIGKNIGFIFFLYFRSNLTPVSYTHLKVHLRPSIFFQYFFNYPWHFLFPSFCCFRFFTSYQFKWWKKMDRCRSHNNLIKAGMYWWKKHCSYCSFSPFCCVPASSRSRRKSPSLWAAPPTGRRNASSSLPLRSKRCGISGCFAPVSYTHLESTVSGIASGIGNTVSGIASDIGGTTSGVVSGLESAASGAASSR